MQGQQWLTDLVAGIVPVLQLAAQLGSLHPRGRAQVQVGRPHGLRPLRSQVATPVLHGGGAAVVLQVNTGPAARHRAGSGRSGGQVERRGLDACPT